MRNNRVHTERGLDRMILFSDAVIAIAITLVILPLVDEARDLDGKSVADFLENDATRLIAAAISFAVIGAFWHEHHRLFELATGYTSLLLRINLLWLAGVVFLPVATVLYVSAGQSDRTAIALYLGTVAFTMLMTRIEEVVLAAAGLRIGGALTRAEQWTVATPLILIAVALTLALTIPALGLWPVLILLLARPISRLSTASINNRRHA
jgi:uncharacterized membrane protein